MKMKPFSFPVHSRLAFREFGLSIGLRALGRLGGFIKRHPEIFRRSAPLISRVEGLLRYSSAIETIEKFWLDPSNREAKAWLAHRDINMVMLATSLAPDTFLTL